MQVISGDRISPCSPGWPWYCYVIYVGLHFATFLSYLDLPSAGIKVCTNGHIVNNSMNSSQITLSLRHCYFGWRPFAPINWNSSEENRMICLFFHFPSIHCLLLTSSPDAMATRDSLLLAQSTRPPQLAVLKLAVSSVQTALPPGLCVAY